MANYYVATIGDNGNDGSILNPWATFTYAASVIAAYDTVYVRGGTYHEECVFRVDNVTLMAYPDETPIVDGEKALPLKYAPLISFRGDYSTIDGIHLVNSTCYGVEMLGAHSVARNCYGEHLNKGLIRLGGAYSLAEDNEAWWTNDGYEYGSGSGSWGSAINTSYTHDVTFRRNKIHQCWGEGLAAHHTSNILMEDNEVYDNYAVNIYLNLVETATVCRNLVYGVPGSVVWNTGFHCPGIGLADEDTEGQNTGLTIVNNIIHNTSNGALYFWEDADGSGIKDSLIAFNSIDMRDQPFDAIHINDGEHGGSRITSNIAVGGFSVPDGIAVDHNMISGDPLWGQGSGATAFRLTSESPAIDDAAVDTGITEDFWGTSRGTHPDIGAVESEESEEPMGAVDDMQVAIDALAVALAEAIVALAEVQEQMAALQAVDDAADALAAQV